MKPYEQQKRLHFWVSALFLGFLATVLVGQTLISTIDAWKRCKSQIHPKYSKMEDQTTANLRPKWTYSTRLFITLSFFGNVFASCSMLAWSSKSQRLSKIYGMDYECYFALFMFGGLWTILQAVVASCRLNQDESFAITAFAEACFASMAPILSDHYDTMKDAMFAFLCFRSSSIEVCILGGVSLAYLVGLHLYLICFDKQAVAELAESHLAGLLMAPQAPPQNSENLDEPSPVDRSSQIWNFVLFTIYKQMTPTKRRLLMLENVPQALFALFYLHYEGGSVPVVVMNLMLPTAQIVFAWTLFTTIRAHAGPQLGEKLRKFLLAGQRLRLERLWTEADFANDIGLLKAAMPSLHPKYPPAKVQAEDFKAVLVGWEAFLRIEEDGETCEFSFCGLDDDSFFLLHEFQVFGDDLKILDLSWNCLGPKCFEEICEIVERSKMLTNLSLRNTMLDDDRLEVK
eukprot:s119_g32.t1